MDRVFIKRIRNICKKHKQKLQVLQIDEVQNESQLRCLTCLSEEKFMFIPKEQLIESDSKTLIKNWPILDDSQIYKKLQSIPTQKELKERNIQKVLDYFKCLREAITQKLNEKEKKIIINIEKKYNSIECHQEYYNLISQKENLKEIFQNINSDFQKNNQKLKDLVKQNLQNQEKMKLKILDLLDNQQKLEVDFSSHQQIEKNINVLINQMYEFGEYQEKAKQLASKIQVKEVFNQNKYDMNTIKQVVEQSVELASDQYIELTLKNRKERRQYLETDMKKYEQLIFTHREEVKKILKEAQKSIIKELKISDRQFEISLSSNNKQVNDLQDSILLNIKHKIKSSKYLSVDTVKDIIKFQINFLQTKSQFINSYAQKYSSSANKTEQIKTFIGTFISDVIFKEFDVEDEDQTITMPQPIILQNDEIISLVQKAEEILSQKMLNILPS